MIRYGDYLKIDQLLNAQEPESAKFGAEAHEEMLFIITHQTFELWFKQVLHEVGSIIGLLDRPYIPESDMGVVLHRLRRTNAIMEHLAKQFTLMETMTASQFMEFRAYLNPASGFQSAQFRVLERSLGLPEQRRVLRNYMDSLPPQERAAVDEQTTGHTTLFGAVERWLQQMPFMEYGEYAFWQEYRNAVADMFERDRRDTRAVAEADGNDPAAALEQIDKLEDGFDAMFDVSRYEGLQTQGLRRMSQRATLAAVFIWTYRQQPLLHTPASVLDAIVELDSLMSLWRFRHVTMVSKMIGMRVGTGGSSGFDYLMATTMRQRVFDDLTSLSSFLIPQANVPQLPNEVAQRLQFVNEFRS